MKSYSRRLIRYLVMCSAGALFTMHASTPEAFAAATMSSYCAVPPFVAQSVPPLTMLVMGKDQNLFHQAYSDAADLNGDGKLDIDYTHSIDYYGYFDSYKCYTYDSSAGRFNPDHVTTDKFCANGQWSGNVLNWVSMSRMDVLRKVLYGGHRVVDGTDGTTVLQRAYIPMDGHSWGKELTGKLCNSGTTYTHSCSISTDCDSGYACVDVAAAGKYIIPYPAATTPTVCTAVATGTPVANDLLVTRYQHASSKGCSSITDSTSMINSYEPVNLFNPSTTAIGTGLVQYVTGFDNATLSPSDNYADNYNILVVTNFTPDVSGTWQFAVDGDDAVEVQVGGTVVAQYLGCHGASGGQSHSGTITLTAGTTYTIVARHFEQSGGEGVQVWFKRPGAANWKFVSSSSTTTGATTGLYAPLNLSAPNIVAGNECAVQDPTYVSTGAPKIGNTVTSGTAKQHLFCNTTLSDNGTPLLRVMTNMSNRIWDWSAKERPECNDSSHGSNYPFSIAPTDYNVKVSVCKSGLLESDCRAYGSSSAPIYKPAGLLQKYGEGDGTKVCSKSYSVPCTDNTQCPNASDGICIYKAPMYFGMVSGSYTNNLDGGVLRKNISSMLDEVNTANGTFNNATDGIIQTFEQIKIEGYDYSSFAYDAGLHNETCGWLEGAALANGQCQNWGNPIGEMMYESIRYLAGKGTPTSAFTYSGTSTDSLLGLPAPAWGLAKGTATYQPYAVYPICSRPFMLVLSDVNPSYDGDKIPGSTYSSVTEDSATPTLGLGAGTPSLLNTLVNTIGTTENIAGQPWFIGENGSAYDNSLCTAKTVANLSTVRGLCPLEPTKQGTYYSSALAYYGKNGFKAATGFPEINTYSVAISPPFADLKIKAGSGYITLVPTAKSVSGSLGVYEACAKKCTALSYDASTYDTNNSVTHTGKGLSLATCPNTAFCPTNQVVNFFVDDIRYDDSNNVVYVVFRINYEDSEQGADYDMDTIVKYEVCTQTAITLKYGSCGSITPALGSNIQINMWTEYGAGDIDQVLGFTISGTNADGVYLPVKDGDVPNSATSTTPAVVAAMPLTWSGVFTPNSTPSDFLKNPLWYAAKWGGFTDTNTNLIPDQRSEWAKNCTSTDITQCDPDNYFLVTNPLQLETQLNSALTSILARVSSGTASSILNNSEGSGANLLQAVFYPQKTFEDNTIAVNWIGEVQNLWYYLDPFFNSSTVRVDTNNDYALDLQSDYIAHFRFDTGQNQTVVDLVNDVNGTGKNLVGVGTYLSDDANVKSLWRAGNLLWRRNVTNSGTSKDPRNIYTVTSSTAGASLSSFVSDGSFNANSTVQTLLQAASTTEASAIINYTLGIDQPSSGYRSRQVTITGCGLTDSQGCTREWKLGDIINSTPKLESTVKLQSYDLASPNGYGDSSYATFAASTNYKQRGMAYVGANDGMLHAFKLGILDVSGQTATHKATMRNADGTAATSASNLGREEWAFIPRNALPYLKYLADPAYSHLFTVDLTSTLVDASINNPSDNDNTAYPNCSATNYWNCGKKTTTATDSNGNVNLNMDKTSWRTILIGGMGAGGASQNLSNTCTDQVASGTCVKTPIDGVGYSSYFALDVTNPETLPGNTDPVKFLWEFSGDPANGNYLGYATTGPAVVRIGSGGKNGRWFAVFGSGPTGPIDTITHAFQGTSNQNLKLFVVDMATGTLVTTIDTGVTNAFAGSLSNAVIDVDKWSSQTTGFYSDDAIYVGYVQKDTTAGTWTKGGVVRVMTKQNSDPAQWITSTVINGIGPVTTSVTKLQDRTATYTGATSLTPAKGKLWLYFGTGRYYYKSDALTNQFTLYGVQDPCYSSNSGSPSFTAIGTTNSFDTSGTTATCKPTYILTESNLQDQSGTASAAPATTLSSSATGWYIRLDTSALNDGYSSERVITNPVASTAGAVFFTTFRPTADICGYGGNSYIWGVKYDTGATPPSAATQGKALMQVSTGALAEISLSSAFGGQSNKRYNNRRTATATSGMPPSANGLALVVGPKPTKKILHYQEK